MILILIVGLFTPSLANAQDIETPIPTIDALNLDIINAFILASDEQVTLGEPFTISIIIEAPPNALIEAFPDYPETASFEVIEADIWSSTPTGATVTHRQDLEVVLWQVGRYLSPELFVIYRLDDGEAQSAPIRSFTVFVQRTIENPELETMRPSVPPIRLPYTSPWFYAAIVAAGVAIIWLGLFIEERLTAPMSPRTRIERQRGTPAQVSIAQLEDLQVQNLPVTTVYPAVAAILRLYLQVQHEVETAELTTMELFEVLRRDKLFEREHEMGLEDIFNQSDLVKFANFEPDVNSGKRLIEATIVWLRDDERYLVEKGQTVGLLTMRKLDNWDNLDTVETRLKDIWQEGSPKDADGAPK